MRVLALVYAAFFGCVRLAHSSEGLVVDAGRQEAYRLWKAGVAAVIDGQNKMADELWRRCLAAYSGSDDCRAGLILLGHQELAGKRTEAAAPPRETGLRPGAKPVISGLQDRRAAVKNWNTGMKHYQQGEFRKAHDAWARCLELDPSSQDCADGIERTREKLRAGDGPRKGDAQADLLYREGMRHLMNKDRDKARAAWEKCLEADPSHPDCRQGLRLVGEGSRN